MIRSQIDTNIGDREFELLEDQDHMEEVWKVMQPRLEQYVDEYLEGVSHYKDKPTPGDSYAALLAEMIKKNDRLHDKYHDLFDMDLMEEEYAEDTEGFKAVTLKKECDVINKALQSKSEAMGEWKSKFYGCKSQQIYDTFYNMMCFAEEYDSDMTEEELESVDTIEDIGLAQMSEDACYQTGVLGFGIVSNILNHMYPRVFPGNYKAGVYSLHFLTNKGHGVNMPSDSSEFLMVKDDSYSKTGIIETEHNYYFPYQTFGLYSLRIYRYMESRIKSRFKKDFPSDYRYLLTNDFYEYVTSVHRQDIATLCGNDDMLKFNTIW
ncbi:hypothetical protein [Butyrivibrio sp. XPD2006]|uniref:hypothetical protein n=1 Tax=Butyrivibrio sp. XPD2006 TaxID=1280668 RepID=UPI0003B614A4|nr:hypothetical protein [Butyrivibrio sp. XPD2006]